MVRRALCGAGWEEKQEWEQGSLQGVRLSPSLTRRGRRSGGKGRGSGWTRGSPSGCVFQGCLRVELWEAMEAVLVCVWVRVAPFSTCSSAELKTSHHRDAPEGKAITSARQEPNNRTRCSWGVKLCQFVPSDEAWWTFCTCDMDRDWRQGSQTCR